MIGSSSPFSENNSPSLVRHRTSIENLKRASPVKNSTMFAREQAREYNPTSPVVIERPLRAHKRGESQTHIPIMSKSKTLPLIPSSRLPEDDDDKVLPPQPLRRQAKSVTFDTGPPQINEYEMATPDPSSVTSGSREGSYDDIYDDESFQDEDSFDASLEDTDKTPVVLPYDVEAPPTPSKEWYKFRTASTGSDIDSRPLPPVPTFLESDSRRNSSNILERVHNAQRSLPVLPQAASVSKSDILGMKDNTMSLEDRLRLMGMGDDSAMKSISRGGTPEKSRLQLSPSPAKSITPFEDRIRQIGLGDPSIERQPPDQATREKNRLQRHGLGIHIREDETATTGNPGLLSNFTFPRISRESIMRKIKSRSVEYEEEVELASSPPCSSPPRGYDVHNLDPDVPIPSREISVMDDDDVFIKQEAEEEEPSSLYAIPALLTSTVSPQPEEEEEEEEEERSGSVVRYSIEDSVYSTVETGAEEYEGPPTPRAETPRVDDMTSLVEPIKQEAAQSNGKVSLPEFASILDDSDFHEGLFSYMSSGSDELPTTPTEVITSSQETSIYVEREVSPVQEAEIEEREQTPDSVIHHAIESTESLGRVSPVIPEPIATIKAPGSKLKTRPSATPADLQTMAATRRQVSGTHPPPVPEKSPKRLSMTAPVDVSIVSETDSIDRAVAQHKKRRESFKPKIEFGGDMGQDLSLNLDMEFSRVLESSKVFNRPFRHYLVRTSS
jgi:hypothetical protein